MQAQGSSALPYQVRMARGLERCGVPVQLVLSGKDQTAQEFVEATGTRDFWKRAVSMARPVVRTIDEADHTFSHPRDKKALMACTESFLEGLRKAVPSRALDD